jgi:hypothetical protein
MASLPFDSTAPIKAASATSTGTATAAAITSTSDDSHGKSSSDGPGPAAASVHIVNEDKLHLCSRLASQIMKRSQEVIRERLLLQSFL